MAFYLSKIKLTRLLNSQLKPSTRWTRVFSDQKGSDDTTSSSSSSSSDDEPSSTQEEPHKEISTIQDAHSTIVEIQPKKSEQEEKAEKAKAKLEDLLASLKTKPIGKPDEPAIELSKPEIGALRKMRKEKSLRTLVEPDMLKAVDKVAASIPDEKLIKNELLTRLLGLARDVHMVKSNKSVNEILVGIKIEPPTRKSNRQETHYQPPRLGSPIGIYGKKPLHIFTNKSFEKSVVNVPTWDILAKHELAMVGATTPNTPYEEMILWTEKGMLWKYPIDNEQGMEQEASVPFHEHVFLERHLEEGFPMEGPVRDFMELVCMGLSKNPFISVRRKLDHIQWFRDYFKDKASLLHEAPESM